MDHKAPGQAGGRGGRTARAFWLPHFILLLPTAKLLFYLRLACLIIDKITSTHRSRSLESSVRGVRENKQRRKAVKTSKTGRILKSVAHTVPMQLPSEPNSQNFPNTKIK